jgi:hypothetical protein
MSNIKGLQVYAGDVQIQSPFMVSIREKTLWEDSSIVLIIAQKFSKGQRFDFL